MEIVVTRGKGQDSIKVLALDPVLVLAGSVARVGTHLEHVDDDDFDRNDLGLRTRAGEGRDQEKKGKEAHRKWYRDPVTDRTIPGRREPVCRRNISRNETYGSYLVP